jgi:uncharacterized protein (DUF302 family)
MATPDGITTYKSAFNVTTTLDRLTELAASKGLKVFSRIDFAHDARDAGLVLRDEQLLIFGNPKAGTPLMQIAPTVGLDLPFKALAYEDAEGTTWISFNEPTYILSRHAITTELERNIHGAVDLIRIAAGISQTGTAKIQ